MRIKYIETASYYKIIAYSLANRCYCVPQQPCTIFKTAAVTSFSCMAGKEFTHKIAVAGFYVYSVKTGFFSQHC